MNKKENYVRRSVTERMTWLVNYGQIRLPDDESRVDAQRQKQCTVHEIVQNKALHF
jgi:hypothetical protein